MPVLREALQLREAGAARDAVPGVLSAAEGGNEVKSCRDCPHATNWHDNGGPAKIESGYCEVAGNAVLGSWKICEHRMEELKREASKEATR